MTSLQQFTYGNHAVRTVTRDGDPWFIAADVAQILGYRDAANLTRRIDDEDKGTHLMSTPSGSQNFSVISEPGLYVAVIGSKVESARMFKRWVTHEVIPSIRKTGSYAVPQTREEQLSNAVLIAQEMIVEKQGRIEELEPAAEAWHDVVGAKGSMSFRDAAKALHDHDAIRIGGNKLIDHCLEWGWIYRPQTTDKHKTPAVRAKQPKLDQGVFVEKASSYIDRFTGEKKISSAPQVRVTGKGISVIRERLMGLLGGEAA